MKAHKLQLYVCLFYSEKSRDQMYKRISSISLLYLPASVKWSRSWNWIPADISVDQVLTRSQVSTWIRIAVVNICNIENVREIHQHYFFKVCFKIADDQETQLVMFKFYHTQYTPVSYKRFVLHWFWSIWKMQLSILLFLE